MRTPLQAGMILVLSFGIAALAQDTLWFNDQAQSTLVYSLRHPLHVVEGKSRKVACSVEIKSDTLSSIIRCSVPVNSFDSDNENRDSHMLEAVEALRFPKVGFVGRPIRHDQEHWIIGGDLSFHGITRPVEFPVQVAKKDTAVLVRGRLAVSLTDFQIERPSLLLVKTDDTVYLDLRITGKGQP